MLLHVRICYCTMFINCNCSSFSFKRTAIEAPKFSSLDPCTRKEPLRRNHNKSKVSIRTVAGQIQRTALRCRQFTELS